MHNQQNVNFIQNEQQDFYKLKEEFGQLCLELFTHDNRGKRLSELLTKYFLQDPVAPANVSNDEARIREGQNQMIRILLNSGREFLAHKEQEKQKDGV